MNTSVNWLSALLGRGLDPMDVARRLATLGAPVDEIETLFDGLSDIVIARVESAEKHPNADRLTLCQVNDGSGVVDVVCGAPNVTAGKKYPYAAVGTVLPGGLELTARKIRGIASNGMLCSARELELGDDHEGILELTKRDGTTGIRRSHRCTVHLLQRLLSPIRHRGKSRAGCDDVHPKVTIRRRAP